MLVKPNKYWSSVFHSIGAGFISLLLLNATSIAALSPAWFFGPAAIWGKIVDGYYNTVDGSELKKKLRNSHAIYAKLFINDITGKIGANASLYSILQDFQKLENCLSHICKNCINGKEKEMFEEYKSVVGGTKTAIQTARKKGEEMSFEEELQALQIMYTSLDAL